jgi:hypothetical protein
MRNVAKTTSGGTSGATKRSLTPGRETLYASIILFIVVNAAFFPVLWGNRTLLASARDASSVYSAGALPNTPRPPILRSRDIGAPGWQFEPGLAFQRQQMFEEHHLPLWNPYIGYGAPWAANMMSQPFFPPAFLASLNPSPAVVDWFIISRLFISGLFTYLFLRLFLGFPAAVTGSIAFALSGYFIVFINIDHLSTEAMLPLVFYAFERQLRRQDRMTTLVSMCAVLLSIISGMPESTFLVLSFGYAYVSFRVLTDTGLRATARSHLLRLVLVNAAGFGLAALLLVPFFEFLHHGLDSHRSSITGTVGGLIHSVGFQYLLLYLLPLATGTLGANILHNGTGMTELLNYFGITPFALAVAAVCTLVRRPASWRAVEYLTVFFTGAVVFMLLKHYGHPSVNWIGALPVFNLVLFPKYIQPLISFAVAVLAGAGFGAITGGRLPVAVAASVPVVVMAVLLGLAQSLSSYIPKADVGLPFYTWVIYGLAGLVVLTLLFVLARTATGRRFRLAAASAIGLAVTVELLCNYIYPAYYLYNDLPTSTYNPYAGGAYIRFLQQQRSMYRVFGREAMLYPNWAAAFGLFDVRYINGVNYDRYFHFIRGFLAPPDLGLHGDLADRFTGDGYPYKFDSPLFERFLQLSSIRYIISGGAMPESALPLVTAVLEQNRERIRRENLAVTRTSFAFDNVTRDVLFQHPPAPQLQVVAYVDKNYPTLKFTPVIDPSVARGCGDGVDFTIDIQTTPDSFHRIYQKYINPKSDPSRQNWTDDTVTLERYSGQKVTLLLTTEGGPAGDTSCDSAGWGGLRFAAPDGREPAVNRARVREIYRADARIYEYPYSLPRASLFSTVAEVRDGEEALTALRSDAADVWSRVIVETRHIGPETARLLTEMRQQTQETATAASILHYDSQRVVIRAAAKHPSILMLTDSNYPGWNVYVDGRKADLLKANYLFRGVALSPGSHDVEFRYEPTSYAYGSGVTMMALAGIVLWWRRSRPLASHSIADDTSDTAGRPLHKAKVRPTK